MELKATMELRVGRDKSTGKKGIPYIARDKDPTVIHLPARGQRYYHSRPAVLPQGHAVSGTTARQKSPSQGKETSVPTSAKNRKKQNPTQ